MMTSLELFSACLVLGGLAAAGAYTYTLNRSSPRSRDTDADNLSDTSTRDALHRQEAGEKKFEEFVTRADLAASSAEASAVRAEAASRTQGGSLVRWVAGVKPMMVDGGFYAMELPPSRAAVSKTEDPSLKEGVASTPTYTSMQ